MINKALRRRLISIHLVSWGSFSKVKKFRQWVLASKHYSARAWWCMLFSRISMLLLHEISWWEVFFEKWQQINFFFPSKLWLNSFKIVVISLPSHRNWKTHFRTEAKIKFFMRPNYGSPHRNLILVSKLKWWL